MTEISPEIGSVVKLVTKTGWSTKCQILNIDPTGVTVRLSQGERRIYPWTEVKCIRWGGPTGEQQTEEVSP